MTLLNIRKIFTPLLFRERENYFYIIIYIIKKEILNPTILLWGLELLPSQQLNQSAFGGVINWSGIKDSHRLHNPFNKIIFVMYYYTYTYLY